MAEQYNVEFINPVLNAVQSVLSSMANIEVVPGKPYLNKKRTSVGDITGLLEIDGYSKGVLSLSLGKDVILSIVNNMLFENYTELNDDIADAVGELTNMISGQARKELAESGMVFKAKTPRVVQGKGRKLDHIPSSPILSVPFSCAKGKLVVEISIAGQ
ncbi:chemotaxis protein CheX [Desulfonatronovibrio hydrogenovorans]|uniref:chemotaxis protein CheX n=1 Tax=Desulfonatronovibrio hydrogenovorans TaxID=53245 RepID=UPI00048F6B05|nr:chemotaxis protein CheX [Desulfonatronovibrio hydrogenovorans]